jgi:hypothetical protein
MGGCGRWKEERGTVIFLAEAEELADLGCTLGTETFGVNGIGEALCKS